MKLRSHLLVLALLALLVPPADGRVQDDGSGEEVEQSRSARVLENIRSQIERRNEGAGGDVRTIEDRIEVLAAGMTGAEFEGEEEAPVDFDSEIKSLLEPLLALIKDATENAREIERLKRAIGAARTKERTARGALENVHSLLDEAAGDEVVVAELSRLRGAWEERASDASHAVESLEHQLEERMSNRGARQAEANEAASAFFRDRGLSLLFGVTTFIVALTVLRFLHRIIVRLRGGDKRGRSFKRRLFDLVYAILTVVIATVAMLAVFNARHDWLLLGLASLLLLTVAWVGLKLVPGMIEQVTLLLNLGAVQEGERVLFEGVPYRVKRLDFYTDLDNPMLDGARITLPVRTLCGLHSRPSGDKEPWFPTSKGDMVMLSDGIRGRVVSQSPEHVEIAVPGGSHVTYSTQDFLAEKPKNISLGYRAEVTFGLSYSHQAEATGEIIDALEAHVQEGLGKLVPAEQLVGVSVEVLEAADSAIVYEVEADLDGAAAPRMEAVERELARLCVEAATRNGWEIPFPQMVVHGVGG